MPWGLQYSIGGTSQNQRGNYNAFTNNFMTFGGLQVTQPLLRGFGFSGSSANLGLRVAKANRAISEWQYRQTVIDTITNVVVAYSNLAAADASLRTAQRTRDLAAGLVAENEKRFKVGSMSENDVTLRAGPPPFANKGSSSPFKVCGTPTTSSACFSAKSRFPMTVPCSPLIRRRRPT
jgi:outer membrane protein